MPLTSGFAPKDFRIGSPLGARGTKPLDAAPTAWTAERDRRDPYSLTTGERALDKVTAGSWRRSTSRRPGAVHIDARCRRCAAAGPGCRRLLVGGDLGHGLFFRDV